MQIKKISFANNNFIKCNNYKQNSIIQARLNKIAQDTVSFKGSRGTYIEDIKNASIEELNDIIARQSNLSEFLTRYDYTLKDGYTTPLHVVDAQKAKILLEASCDKETTKKMIFALNGSNGSVFKNADYDKARVIIEHLEKINEDVNFFMGKRTLSDLNLSETMAILLNIQNNNILQHILLTQHDPNSSNLLFHKAMQEKDLTTARDILDISPDKATTTAMLLHKIDGKNIYHSQNITAQEREFLLNYSPDEDTKVKLIMNGDY